MLLSEPLTSLANSFRKSSGLTDKLGLLDMTALMEAASFPNLIWYTTDAWTEGLLNYDVNATLNVPIKMGESIEYSFEYKQDANAKSEPGVMLILRDKDKNMLNQWGVKEGETAPVTGSSALAGFWMQMKDEAGLKRGFYTVSISNVAFIEAYIEIPGTDSSFQYRKPMATYGKEYIPWTSKYLKVGGVVKAVLSVLLPVRGCLA